MTNELKSQTSPEFRYSISSFQHQENKSGEIPGLPMWFHMWSFYPPFSSLVHFYSSFLNELYFLKYKNQTYYI